MVGVSELMGEKEIIFPEMAALTIGMWIVDKKVWTVSRLKLVLLMSIGAIVGVCIVRYSPFPLIVNLCISFAFSAICLQVSRTTDISLYAPDPFRDGELGISDSRDGYVVGGRWRTKVDGEK